MDKTIVLLPFEKGTKEKPLSKEQLLELNRHKSNFKRIEDTLNSWGDQPQNKEIFSMVDFLKHLNMSYLDYVNAIRSSIQIDSLFKKVIR